MQSVTEFVPSRFKGQVAVISGGGQGIGFGIATRLAAEGAHVALFDFNQSVLDKATEELKAQNAAVSTHLVDVTDFKQVEEAMQSVHKALGRIDALIACAGITGKTNLKSHEVDINDFHRVFNVNVNGVFYCCKAVLPFMLAKNYGRIVNIASIAGKEGNAGMLAYSSSKAAVIGLTKVIGKDYAETGITCNAVAPAVVRTAMVDSLPEQQVRYMTDKIPMKRCGTIQEIASLVAFVASKEASFTTGFTWDATGGRATY